MDKTDLAYLPAHQALDLFPRKDPVAGRTHAGPDRPRG